MLWTWQKFHEKRHWKWFWKRSNGGPALHAVNVPFQFLHSTARPAGWARLAEIFSCRTVFFGCLKANDVFFSANLGLLSHFHLKPRFSSKVSQNLDAAEWIYGAKTMCFDFGEWRKWDLVLEGSESYCTAVEIWCLKIGRKFWEARQ